MKRNLAKFLTVSAAFFATMPLLQNCSVLLPGIGNFDFDDDDDDDFDDDFEEFLDDVFDDDDDDD